jgi:hypothetical protein
MIWLKKTLYELRRDSENTYKIWNNSEMNSRTLCKWQKLHCTSEEKLRKQYKIVNSRMPLQDRVQGPFIGFRRELKGLKVTAGSHKCIRGENSPHDIWVGRLGSLRDGCPAVQIGNWTQSRPFIWSATSQPFISPTTVVSWASEHNFFIQSLPMI